MSVQKTEGAKNPSFVNSNVLSEDTPQSGFFLVNSINNINWEVGSLDLIKFIYVVGANEAFNKNSDLFSNTLVNSHYIPIRAIILDNASVPFVNYGGTIGLQRNPVQIIFTAQHYYYNWSHNRDETSKRIFLNNVNWLVNNAVRKGNYSLVEYRFNYSVPYPPTYLMKAPWYSGMAQALALPVLAKAYEISNETKYLDTAEMLLNSFLVEVKNGGVTYKTPNDGWWYEEYPVHGNEPRVLNGMIWAVLGIYEYYNITHKNEAKYLFDQGVLALKRNLSYYDDNGYSYYDLITHHNTPFYARLHIRLLSNLYNITKEEVFKAYHDKWLNFQLTRGNFTNST